MKMSKVVSFAVTLAYLLALCLVLTSCSDEEKTKDGTVVLSNTSSYSEDDPVTAELYESGEILATNSVGKGKRVTWTDVPPEVSLSIKVTDKRGRSTSTYSFRLDLNETRKYKYDGSSISQIYDDN
ncbi:MAG: hypothetical protein LBC59_02705 [Chitinispirillales bacterium]|jgi:ABC-type oligopeptide transport system substrate-binding subunit|nr:hypothetical protein [Chitinispirillales bacterium]